MSHYTHGQRLIIGLIGDNRVGKDTVAHKLQYYLGESGDQPQFNTIAFADCVKNVGRELFGFTVDQLYGDKKEIVDARWGITPRQFMTTFGTNIMQYDIYKYFDGLIAHVPPRTFWAKRTLDNIRPHIHTHNYIITDIRFNHELDEIHKFISAHNNNDGGEDTNTNTNTNIKFVLIKIERPTAVTAVDSAHPSRSELLNILATKPCKLKQTYPTLTHCIHIINDSTLKALEDQIQMISYEIQQLFLL